MTDERLYELLCKHGFIHPRTSWDRAWPSDRESAIALAADIRALISKGTPEDKRQ